MGFKALARHHQFPPFREGQEEISINQNISFGFIHLLEIKCKSELIDESTG